MALVRVETGKAFRDAVHPGYQSRPAHGWFAKGERAAIKATSGRKRLNIHGASDLETCMNTSPTTATTRPSPNSSMP